MPKNNEFGIADQRILHRAEGAETTVSAMGVNARLDRPTQLASARSTPRARMPTGPAPFE
jgi:hypothetical protein